MENNTVIHLCKKVISRQGIELEELGRLIAELSQLYDKEKTWQLQGNYPGKDAFTAMLWDMMHINRFTRRQFADKLGISYYQLGAVLRGENRVGLATARRLMKSGVDAHFILRHC